MDWVTRLDDFYLDIENISDTMDYSIAVHEYPYTNKNKLEHIGQKTRKIKIKCVFSEIVTPSEGWDVGLTQPTYENHYDFLEHIKQSILFTFIHPNYGELTGCINSITVTHDDTRNFAAIDFDFLVQSTEEPSYLKPIEAKQAASFASLNLKLLSGIKVQQKLAKNLRYWTGQIQQAINQLNAQLRNITSPATTIANTIYYASDVPSLLLEAINMAIDRAIQPVIALQKSPASTINNMIVAATGVKNTFLSAFPNTDQSVVGNYITQLIASRVSYEAAVIYEADNTNAVNQDNQSKQRIFDENGNFVGGIDYVETMTIDELDDTCYNLKTVIDEAVQLDRSQEDLKTQGMLLQKYINDIKLNRERIVTETEVPLQSFHGIARDQGISYNRADQLLKLNPRIHNPTFAYGDIRILAKQD